MSEITETEPPYYYAVEFVPNAGNELIPGDNRHLNKKNEFESVTKPDQIKRFADKEQAAKVAQFAETRPGAVVKILCNLYDSEI